MKDKAAEGTQSQEEFRQKVLKRGSKIASHIGWRLYWFHSGRNIADTARHFGVSPAVVMNRSKRENWQAWADDIQKRALRRVSTDVVSGIVSRRRRLLKLVDQRIASLTKAVLSRKVAGSVARELQILAQVSELLTGGATDRIEAGQFLHQFDRMDLSEQRRFIEGLRSGRIGGSDEN